MATARFDLEFKLETLFPVGLWSVEDKNTDTAIRIPLKII